MNEGPNATANTRQAESAHPSGGHVAPLEIALDLAAPAETVWHALATTKGLKRWWWQHWDDTEIEAEVRVGGQYLITASKAGISVRGEYLTVEPPQRLEYTWQWTDQDGTGAIERVEIGLIEQATGTRLHLRHTGPWADNAPKENLLEGWKFVLGELTTTLSAGST